MFYPITSFSGLTDTAAINAMLGAMKHDVPRKIQYYRWEFKFWKYHFNFIEYEKCEI